MSFTHDGQSALLLRAGYWRRAIATLLDLALVAIPFQILAAVLFMWTNGAVQESFGVNINLCRAVDGTEIARYGTALTPPPPAGSNYAVACKSTLFGIATSSSLTVGRKTVERRGLGTYTQTRYQAYALDAAGQPVQAVHWDWVVQLAFAGYLLWWLRNTGTTWGMKVMGTRLIILAAPEAEGVGLGRILARYLVGVFPLAIAAGALLADPLMTNVFWAGFAVFAAFTFWVLYDLCWKQDPIYDRLTGTAVILTKPLPEPGPVLGGGPLLPPPLPRQSSMPAPAAAASPRVRPAAAAPAAGAPALRVAASRAARVGQPAPVREFGRRQ